MTVLSNISSIANYKIKRSKFEGISNIIKHNSIEPFRIWNLLKQRLKKLEICMIFLIKIYPVQHGRWWYCFIANIRIACEKYFLLTGYRAIIEKGITILWLIPLLFCLMVSLLMSLKDFNKWEKKKPDWIWRFCLNFWSRIETSVYRCW